MRPFIFIVGVFGFAYTSWSLLTGAAGSEISVIGVVAYDFYSFGRMFYSPSGPLSEHSIYLIVGAVLIVVFLAMILMGVFGKGEKK